MAYALIKCFDKKAVEAIVPAHWIEDKTMWWPSNHARQLAIDLAPLDKSWKSYAVLEIKRYSTYFVFLRLNFFVFDQIYVQLLAYDFLNTVPIECFG